ncbi:MAG: divalent-cation tolerance protein CutA, partial [Acidobacteria bacterium]|nr:divalent-cation tolerance protein CutA [Acidobacteriota bacterium]
MEPIILVITTTNSEELAVKIAESLVQRGYAACVNIIKKIRSIYRFKGEVWDDDEFLLLIKTRQSLKSDVE